MPLYIRDLSTCKFWYLAEVLVQIFRDTEGWLYVFYFVVTGMVIAEYNTGNLENVI